MDATGRGLRTVSGSVTQNKGKAWTNSNSSDDMFAVFTLIYVNNCIYAALYIPHRIAPHHEADHDSRRSNPR